MDFSDLCDDFSSSDDNTDSTSEELGREILPYQFEPTRKDRTQEEEENAIEENAMPSDIAFSSSCCVRSSLVGSNW